MHTNGFAHSCNNCHDIFSLYANTLQYLAQIVVVDDEIERMLLSVDELYWQTIRGTCMEHGTFVA